MKLRPGDKIYLNLLLWDGVISLPKRVFVELRDQAGALIEPLFEIASVGGGEFRNSTRIMPNDSFVTASYFVYNNDGTTLDATYAAAKDTYMRDFTGEIITTNLDGKVSGAGNISLTGEINTEILTGDIPVEKILEASLVVEETIEGTIEEEVVL